MRAPVLTVTRRPPAGAPQTQSGQRRRPLHSVVFALEVEAPAAQLGALLGALPGAAERLPRLLSARGFSTASALLTGETLKQARTAGSYGQSRQRRCGSVSPRPLRCLWYRAARTVKEAHS